MKFFPGDSLRTEAHRRLFLKPSDAGSGHRLSRTSKEIVFSEGIFRHV
jgi:hypothetical protein